MAHRNKVWSHLTHNTLGFCPVNIPSQEQSRGWDGDFKSHRLKRKQQLAAEIRLVMCDFFVERAVQRREKVEKMSWRMRFLWTTKAWWEKKASAPTLAVNVGATHQLCSGEDWNCPLSGGHRIPIWSPGPQNRHGGNHRRVPFPPLLPKEGTYGHQRAADTLR